MLSWFWQWSRPKFENRSIFDQIKAYKTKCASFLGHPVGSVLLSKRHRSTMYESREPTNLAARKAGSKTAVHVSVWPISLCRLNDFTIHLCSENTQLAILAMHNAICKAGQNSATTEAARIKANDWFKVHQFYSPTPTTLAVLTPRSGDPQIRPSKRVCRPFNLPVPVCIEALNLNCQHTEMKPKRNSFNVRTVLKDGVENIWLSRLHYKNSAQSTAQHNLLDFLCNHRNIRWPYIAKQDKLSNTNIQGGPKIVSH